MSRSQCMRLLITATLVAVTAPLYAQQTPEPVKAPAQAEASVQDADAAAAVAVIAKAKAAAAEAKSSSDGDAAIAKKAKEAGWRPEVRSGVTVYCRQDAVVGSRFTQKRCATETQLAGVLERQEYEREQLKQRGCGGTCGGK
ncbi:MAG: hypothetical protein QOK23_2553 [Gammaproteobacteria bacterium]|jgi:hypothetical protein|nr:hypothetical protein [Gammaproteobacteria bacterium]